MVIAEDPASAGGHPAGGALPTPDEVEARLRAHRPVLIDAWLREIIPIGAAVYGSRELRTRVAALVDRIIPAMARADALARDDARQAGADLAELLYMSGDGLARSHTVLTNMVIHTVPGEWHEARRAAMSILAALIAGHQEQTREIILREQETVRDALVSTLQRTRDDLRDSRARFQSLFLESGIGIWVGDMTGQTLEANPALLTLLGFTEHEMYAADVTRLIHEADRPRLDLLWSQLIGGQIDSFQTETRYLHKRGHTIWGSLTVSLVRDARGQAEYLVAMLQDIGEQRRAAEALRDSYERAQVLVQNSADFIAVIDAWGDFSYLSPAIRPMLGYEPEELLKTEMWQIFADEDLPLVKAFWTELRANPGVPQHRSIRVRRKDGTWCWIGATCANRLDDPAIQGIVVNGRDVTAQIELEDRLSLMAYTDHLTGLSSRLAFTDRLRETLETGRDVAVLVADLDRFKVINDSLGHEAGDQALVALARRFKACIGPRDIVARIGGDEFAVMLVEADEADARSVAQCFLDAMREPVLLQQRQTILNTSIGIAVSGPALGEPGELLRAADLALYRAKGLGRATMATYEPEMHAAAVRRLELEGGLQSALARGELFVVYQPVTDLRSGATVGLEALVRWERPGHGLVPPDEFVLIAEETGQIVPIGRWVMSEACRQMRQWREAGLDVESLVLGINLSGRELAADGLIGHLAGCVNANALEPCQICLEVSERVLIDDVIAAAPVLNDLRGLGAQIAIDDFGTGQTSLAALPRLMASTLKIDRSLIAPLGENPEDTAIIEAIASLARALHMRVCAEGIETAAQHAFVREAGCDHGQGYHYAPPLTAAEMAAHLARA